MRRMSRLLTRRDGVLRAAVAPAVESLESRTLLSISLDSGVLSVHGTSGRDRISFSLKSGNSGTLVATCNSQRAEYAVSSITQIQASGGRGGDSISVSTLLIPAQIRGGAGSDTLAGGSAGDSLWGGGGSDVVMGNDGNNALYGETGDDRILGGAGNDTIVGGGGRDVINGGGGTDSISSAPGSTVNAGAGGLFQPLYRAAATGMTPSATFEFGAVGLVPKQIRTAYEVKYKALGTKGQGQTMYIVDAFTGVNVLGDLNVFSAQFGLPLMDSSNFQIVNANDGGFSPAVDAGWAAEIALDVQWAHAIAPKAKIVLVQADTAFPVDMLRAVQTAARMSESAGGGVVSMSFGTDETDVYNLNFEKVFSSSPRTTFVAAAGDAPGVSYPATSPNVLGVGGTLLNVDSDGNRIPQNDASLQEVAWDLSGGGESTVFDHPDYQSPLGSTVGTYGRLSPDVAYNADPDSGVAVYNSTAIGQFSGWMPGGVGGTSAGSPQWAALIALTNALRAQAGKTAIGTKANVGVYQVAQNDYAATFHDITVGGSALQPAGEGFDLSTGWGTPRATNLVSALVGSNAPFIASSIKWQGTVYNPALQAFKNLTIPAGGTGFATGGSRISVVFNFEPNIWDTTGLVVRLVADDLYSTVPNPANPGTYRVYGNGYVIFGAVVDPTDPDPDPGTGVPTSMSPAAIVIIDDNGDPVIVQGNFVKFNGWITVDAQGEEHIDCDYWAVDALGNKLPTSPFALAQLSVENQELTFGFNGSFES